MGPHPCLGAVVHRAHFQVDGLDGAEGPFDAGEGLVGAPAVLGRHGVLRQGGADDVDTVGLGGDGVLAPCEVEAGCGDGEVLLHAVAVDHRADPEADLRVAFETALGDALAKELQLGLGGLQHGLCGRGDAWVAAGNQAFPGEVGVEEFEEIDGIKAFEGPAAHQLGDTGALEGADPVKTV